MAAVVCFAKMSFVSDTFCFAKLSFAKNMSFFCNVVVCSRYSDVACASLCFAPLRFHEDALCDTEPSRSAKGNFGNNNSHIL